ncbi:MAG: TlpA family protein disulfide reductase [Spirochaetaceae bacterium]|jgi:thiol-disulfide isomerase/thioredoxin|nr:TlpA family protein disulfide reductase [Spirochaetaceae bacterium]
MLSRNKTARLIIAVLIASIAESAFAAPPAAGQLAPDFTISLAGSPNNRKKLSEYRGKPVVLHFWASWCGPCVRELPLIADITSPGANDFAVIAVNCQEPEKVASDFLAKRKLRLNLAMDTNGAISALYGINAIPQTFMIDSEGVIRSVRVGAYTAKTLTADVAALLSK